MHFYVCGTPVFYTFPLHFYTFPPVLLSALLSLSVVLCTALAFGTAGGQPSLDRKIGTKKKIRPFLAKICENRSRRGSENGFSDGFRDFCPTFPRGAPGKFPDLACEFRPRAPGTPPGSSPGLPGSSPGPPVPQDSREVPGDSFPRDSREVPGTSWKFLARLGNS